MESEYPDPDEEFDLIHQDEYELLKEIEESSCAVTENVQKKQVSLDPIDQPSTSYSTTSPPVQNLISNATTHKRSCNELISDFDNYFEPVESSRNVRKEQVSLHPMDQPSTSYSTTSPPVQNLISNTTTHKRSCDELISDFDNYFEPVEPEQKKVRWNEPERVIDIIVARRLQAQIDFQGFDRINKSLKYNTDSVTLTVPRCDFVALTRPSDAQRMYVKFKSNLNPITQNSKHMTQELLMGYDELKKEAEKILIEKEKENQEFLSDVIAIDGPIGNKLWVEKYRPRSYKDLLSDESVNRTFLNWMKLWDKIVFHRDPLPSPRKNTRRFNNGIKNYFDNALPMELDKKGYPVHKVVLLSGPPGLGKTTLAHIVAKHVGYNVVEINASDERSPDAFRQILLASTQMKAVMGTNPRPNCIIFDEIDGAPASSVDILLKFVSGKLTMKSKKKTSNEKSPETCSRPVVCICNEPYTPSLRTLRASALMITVPEVSSTRLAQRLMEISKKENLNVSLNDLTNLVEKFNCDIRSCLGALQYTGGINISDCTQLGTNNKNTGLFDAWREIFSIPKNQAGPLSLRTRVERILRTVQNGEKERMLQGVFHNYPEINPERFENIPTSLNWFQFFDKISLIVEKQQAWVLMPYTNYAYVAWHLNFAKIRNPKVSYPSVVYEMRTKTAKSKEILTAIKRTCSQNITTLVTDVVSHLVDILNPRLRTISGNLYSPAERADLMRTIQVMLDFGITMIQEKINEGNYDYKLEPDIFEVGVFSECKSRRTIPYGVKQILAQELESERLRQISNGTRITNKPTNFEKTVTKPKEPENLKISKKRTMENPILMNNETSVITNNATCNDDTMLLEFLMDSPTSSVVGVKAKDSAVNTDEIPNAPFRKKKAQKLEQLVLSAISSQSDVVNKILEAQTEMVSRFMEMDRDRQNRLDNRLDNLLTAVHATVVKRNSELDIEFPTPPTNFPITSLSPPPPPGVIPPKLDLVPPKPCRVPCTAPMNNIELVTQNSAPTRPGIISPIMSPRKLGTIWSKLGPVSQSPFVKAQERLGFRPIVVNDQRTQSSVQRFITKHLDEKGLNLISETAKFLEMELEMEQRIENARLDTFGSNLTARRRLFTQGEPSPALLITEAFLDNERKTCEREGRFDYYERKWIGTSDNPLAGRGESYERLRDLKTRSDHLIPCESSTPLKIDKDLNENGKQTVQQIAQFMMRTGRWKDMVPNHNQQRIDERNNIEVLPPPRKTSFPMGFDVDTLKRMTRENDELIRDRNRNMRLMDESLAELQRMYAARNQENGRQPTFMTSNGKPVMAVTLLNQGMIERYIQDLKDNTDSDNDEDFLDTTSSLHLPGRKNSLLSNGSGTGSSGKSGKFGNCVIA